MTERIGWISETVRDGFYTVHTTRCSVVKRSSLHVREVPLAAARVKLEWASCRQCKHCAAADEANTPEAGQVTVTLSLMDAAFTAQILRVASKDYPLGHKELAERVAAALEQAVAR
jgi:hypothetical protein